MLNALAIADLLSQYAGPASIGHRRHFSTGYQIVAGEHSLRGSTNISVPAIHVNPAMFQGGMDATALALLAEDLARTGACFDVIIQHPDRVSDRFEWVSFTSLWRHDPLPASHLIHRINAELRVSRASFGDDDDQARLEMFIPLERALLTKPILARYVEHWLMDLGEFWVILTDER